MWRDVLVTVMLPVLTVVLLRLSISKPSSVNLEEGPNENKMSDGGRDRASLEMGVWKSSQKWSVQRSAVRSIAWLDLFTGIKKGRPRPLGSYRRPQRRPRE